VIPELCTRVEGELNPPVLVWRLPRPYRCIASAPLGGGLGTAEWVVNTTVPMSYDRPDPDAHLAVIATELGLVGPGVGMMTGVDVAERVGGTDGGVTCWATVGLGAPAWAAAPDGHLRRLPPPTGHPAPPAHRDEPTRPEPTKPSASTHPPAPGTINLVVVVPARLGDAALVNAVLTATEAKAQALWELGLEATGTASDAICVLSITDGPAHDYAGPRSLWGARLARAVHAAVLSGGRDWLVSGLAWSDASASRHRG
jgi:adenosylcobinamide hydrolase